jgi:inner membrane protein
MDPITHTMAGAVMARAGLDRGGRLPLAGATLMLAANAPDIDIAAMFVGNYTGLAFRRGWTHGPIAWLLLPVALTGIMMLVDRVARRRDPTQPPVDAGALLAIAFVGVLSHPALDWLNTYGIRLLMPFSDRWSYGDAVFIVDPYLWLLLAAALVPWRRTARRVRGFGALAVGYVLVMIAGSVIAEPIGRLAAEAAGIKDVEEVMYQPRPAQPFRGDLIVASADRYTMGEFRWFAGSGDRVSFEGEPIPRGDWAAPAVQRARLEQDVIDYLTWSRFPFVRTDTVAGGIAVSFGDARFFRGPSGGGLAGLRVIVRD